jgi:hypothetical protein
MENFGGQEATRECFSVPAAYWPGREGVDKNVFTVWMNFCGSSKKGM